LVRRPAIISWDYLRSFEAPAAALQEHKNL